MSGPYINRPNPGLTRFAFENQLGELHKKARRLSTLANTIGRESDSLDLSQIADEIQRLLEASVGSYRRPRPSGGGPTYPNTRLF